MKKWMAIVLTLLLALSCAGCGAGNSQTEQPTETEAPVITELDLSGAPVENLEELAAMTELVYLDLRDTGLTTEEYEYLRSSLPECQILWSVPFQGGYLDEETAELTVTSLSMEDAQQLLYLKQLQTVHAEECADFEALATLKSQMPELEIFCTVRIGEEQYAQDVTELVLDNADARSVALALPFFKELTTVSFTGTAPDSEEIAQWKQTYPQTTFIWSFEVCGVPATSLDTELYLNEIPMENVSEVENALKYFYDLQWVEMCDCGIPSEEMDALWKRHPETRFVWKIYMGDCEIRTDETAFITYKFGYGKYNRLTDEECTDLKYCVDMVCLDMGHMAIEDYSFLAYMPKLQYLILADTLGSDFTAITTCTELVFLEVFWTGFWDTSLLQGMTKLEDVNLSYTAVENVEPLLEMDHLHRLWMAGMVVSEEDEAKLREALPDTKILIQPPHALVGCTDDGWRKSPNYYKMRDMLGMWYMD